MRIIDLKGSWKVRIDGDKIYDAILPGTLDENKIGHKDSSANQWKAEEGAKLNPEVITTRLTRRYTYEGPAIFRKDFDAGIPDGAGDNGRAAFEQGDRIFLEAERSRKLSLFIDGQAVEEYQAGTVSTPYIFEVSDKLKAGSRIELVCDNSYPGWPHDAIVYSSAATDETQTNWNGILGYFRLRIEKQVFLSKVRIYPKGNTITVLVDIDAGIPYEGVLRIDCAALDYAALDYAALNYAALDYAALDSTASENGSVLERKITLAAGQYTISFENLPVSPDCRLWDEYEGNLYELHVSGDGLDGWSDTFGIREFGENSRGRLALNGRTIFLRSEANCCVFPETGHMPLTVEEWIKILNAYKEYGINCLRFHSHCPPDAAFTAADRLGILLQPELSHWNPRDAFETEESWNYYQLELRQLLSAYANHPSFVMLTFGNELHTGELGHHRMKELLAGAKAMDPTRLYAIGSNVHYGSRGADGESDFYTSSNYYDKMLRGTSSPMCGYINHCYPNTKTNFSQVLEELRANCRKPVFSFEVGQYEVLPDFEEINDYQGVTLPDNLTYIKEQVTRKGFLKEWRRRVEATGELALLAYREEIEAVLRTGGLSGISLLGLQDFPGQGTALVGMLDAHLKPKLYAFARPERFRSFFCEAVPLVFMDRYTYSKEDTLTAGIALANYGKVTVTAITYYELREANKVILSGELPAAVFPCGEVTAAGRIAIALRDIISPRKLTLSVMIGEYRNEYPVWVYPDQRKEPSDRVVIAAVWSEAVQALERGARVLYSPKADEEHFPSSVQAQFTTDFWSVGTFPAQSGCMGCMMDPSHAVFQEFPTEAHSNWQWWPMSNGRAVILPEIMEEPIITVIDCYARLRRLAFLFEVKVGSGYLMVSSMGLLEKQEYPEVRALTESILGYMASGQFEPKQTVTLEALQEIIR